MNINETIKGLAVVEKVMDAKIKGSICTLLYGMAVGCLIADEFIALQSPWEKAGVFFILGSTYVVGRRFAREEVIEIIKAEEA